MPLIGAYYGPILIFFGDFMNVEDVENYAYSLGGVLCDFPFENDFQSRVLRHKASKKWFGIYLLAPVKSILKWEQGEKLAALQKLFCGMAEVPVLNLKCDPALSLILQNNFTGIVPAYHMNKRNWISVIFGADVPPDQWEQLIRLSYDMTLAAADKI